MIAWPDAACKGSGLDFFSVDKEEVDRCLATCRRCPRKMECRGTVVGKSARVDDGIYGETTGTMRAWARHGLYVLDTPLYDAEGNPKFEYWRYVRNVTLPPGGIHLRNCSACGEEFAQARHIRRASGGYATRCIPCRVPRKARLGALKWLKAVERRCVLCNEAYTPHPNASVINFYCSDRCHKRVHNGKRCQSQARIDETARALANVAVEQAKVDEFIQLVTDQWIEAAYVQNAEAIRLAMPKTTSAA